MAAMNFPANPTDGQLYPAEPNSEYIYSTAKGAWTSLPTQAAKTITSDIAPVNAKDGDQWFNSIDANLYIYYVDVDGGQWVQVKNDASFSSELGPTVDALNTDANTNFIINGAFDIWQRGTSFSASGYTADRWTGDFVTGAGTVSQQAFTPGTAPAPGYEGSYFLRRNVTTGAQFSSLIHRIEDVRTLAGQTVTLSFWAKGTNPTGNFSVNLLQNFGSGGSAQTNLTDQPLVLTSSWARYTYTFTLGSMAGKTIGTGSYLWLSIYQTAANTSASTLDIFGVQLQGGSKATDFHRAASTLQGELAACQRYYYRTTSTGSGTTFTRGHSLTSNRIPMFMTLPVSMRVPPTAVEWTGTASDYTLYGDVVANVVLSNILIWSAAGAKASNTVVPLNIETTSITAKESYSLWSSGANAYIGFSAEL